MKCSQRVISLLLFISSLYSAEIKTKSAISSVTVYNDQALITRIAKEQLAAGTHKVIITNLPWDLSDKSLKVSGKSDVEVTISDIRIERVFLDSLPEGKIAELTERINGLKNEKNALERNTLLMKSQIEAVDAMKDGYVKSLSLQNPGQKVSAEEWDKLLQFVDRKKTEYGAKTDVLRKEIEQKVSKIKSLEDEIRSIGSAVRKEQKQVAVMLKVPAAATVTLEVSYLLFNANWMPTYEFRANSAEKTLQVSYSGNVQQRTTENWSDVSLTLSTARPAMSEVLPTLWKWGLDVRPVEPPSGYIRGGRNSEASVKKVYQPATEMTFLGNTIFGKVVDAETNEPLVGASVVIAGTSLGASTDINGDYFMYNAPEGTHSVRVSLLGYQPVLSTGVTVTKTYGAKQTFYLSSSNIQLGEVEIKAERAMINMDATNTVSRAVGASINLEESVSSSQITSSTFSIPSKQTIPNDNQKHKVGIAVEEIPVHLTYTVVPKVVTSAFLVAKGKNKREYPLLTGEGNVFLDNAFIASVLMQTVMPNDSFSVNLGVDEGIRVERKLVSRFVEKTGTFSVKNRITYEYDNVVENFKKHPVEVLLLDHVPVSLNERFIVEIVEPSPKKMLPDSDGILKWNFTLKEGERRTVKVKFSVDYPVDFTPYGLER